MTPASSTQKFCKTARCPSSEALLQYRRHAVTIAELLAIDRHLRDCDFCSAEVQLLKRHRPEAEDAAIVEMPSHLQKLAASILIRPGDISRIAGMMVRSPLSH